MILFDTETTGLIKNSLQSLEQQPRIVELAALRLHPVTLEEVDCLVFRANPGFPMSPEATTITGITDEALKGEPPFIGHLPALVDFVHGTRTLVAHNLPFDREMLAMELARVDWQYRFPWPGHHVCTVEATSALKGHRLKLGDLYALATGRPMAEVYTAHQALDDVRALAEVVRWMREEDLL